MLSHSGLEMPESLPRANKLSGEEEDREEFKTTPNLDGGGGCDLLHPMP